MVFSAHQQRMRYLVEFMLPDQDCGGVASEGVISEAVEEGAEGEESGKELPEEGTHLYCIMHYNSVQDLPA